MISSKFSPVLRSWQAYRCNNLVYFRHFKCASSFYLELFSKTLQWTQICIQDINWTEDHVFSYIRNPFNKRITGLAEYVCRIYQEENSKDFNHNTFLELLNHPYFSRMIAKTFILDDHSLPIYNILGTNAELVDWIPIDVDKINHVELTLKLLASHNINVDLSTVQNISLDQRNVSIGYKKQFIEQLKTEEIPNLVVTDLDYDDILYNHVLSFIDPTKTAWQEITWLKFHKI